MNFCFIKIQIDGKITNIIASLVVTIRIISKGEDFMQIFTVSFFGHRQIHYSFEKESLLEKLICEVITSKEYVEFLVGRDGDFDQLVSSTILRCKRAVRDDNNSLIWVMPYPTAEYRNNEEAYNNYYDEVEICNDSATGHFKSTFQIRNRIMVDRSDLVIFCVEHSSGGAYQTMQYAKKIGKHFINLASATINPYTEEGHSYEIGS